jgi:hypothetical protein
VVGLADGLAVAFIAARERLTVTVSDDAATLMRGSGATVRVNRPAVDAVFMDDKYLVLLGSSGQELARNGCDLRAEALRTAFVNHGYPWRADGDPYREEFRLWVEDLPGLTEGANALLKARAKALAKRNDGDATVQTPIRGGSGETSRSSSVARKGGSGIVLLSLWHTKDSQDRAAGRNTCRALGGG